MKRIIALLLACILCLSGASAAAARETAVSPTAADTKNVEDIINDIYEGGVREAEGEVFYVPGENNISHKIKLIMDLTGLEHYYPDMAVKKSALKMILRAVYGGDYMYEKYFPTGNSESKLLTYDEAAVAFLDMTGYASLFEYVGSSKAQIDAFMLKSGLTDGIDVSGARKKLTAETFFNMVYNALTAETVRVGANDYITEGGKSLLETYLDLTEVRGIVRANSFTATNSDEGEGKGRLRIADKVYKVLTDESTDDYLGYSVIAYVDKDGGLRSISVDENKNKTLYFDNPDDLVGGSDPTEFVYYEKDRRRTAKIDYAADRLYNYSVRSTFDADFYTLKNGTIKLIDNNGDNKYDMVFKKEYDSFIPYTVSKINESIADANGRKYDIEDVLDGEYRGITDEDGNKLDLSYISTSTPISILAKKDPVLDENNNTVYVATEVIVLDKRTYEGGYQSYDSRRKEYKIGDRKFRLSESYSIFHGGRLPFEKGSHVLVYTDMFGRIVNAETTTSQFKYAWLVGMAEDGFGGETILMKLFTQDSSMNVYELKKRLTLNESSVSADSLYNGSVLRSGGQVVEQLIRYKINSDGKIVGIQTANKDNIGFGAVKKSGVTDFQMNLGYYDSRQSVNNEMRLWFYSASNSLSGKYQYHPDKSKVFAVPSTAARDKYGDDAFYMDGLYNNTQYIPNLYDVDEEYNIGAMVYEAGEVDSSWVDRGYGTYIVSEVGQVWDAEALDGKTSVYAEHTNDTWSGNWSAYTTENGTVYGAAIGEEANNQYKKMLEFGYKWPVGDVRRESYNGVKSAADLKPGMIIRPNVKNTYGLMRYALEFYCPDNTKFRDYCYEFIWEDMGNYEDYYDTATKEPIWSGKMSGVTKQTFYGTDISGFGQVVKKCSDGIVFNAHIGAADQEEWNRRIFAQQTATGQCYDTEKEELTGITMAEVEEGDWIYINICSGKLMGFVVYK